MVLLRIITKKSVPSVMNEKRLLSQLKHPFLVNMTASFQDRETLFLVMDLMPGGDLRYHIGRKRRFSEDQTKFFVACIFLGLEYLHNNNIIHRDIKPENLVLDDKGYVRITDLGIARYWKENNACDTSGTPGYMCTNTLIQHQRSSAGRTTPFQPTTSLWVSLRTSSCWGEGPTTAGTGMRSERRSWRSRSK